VPIGPASSAAPPPPSGPASAAPAKKAVKATKKAPVKKAVAPRSAAKAGPTKKAPAPPDAAAATARGIAVIAVTLFVGLVVFVFGLNKAEQSVDTKAAPTTVPSNTPSTDRNAPPVVTKPDQGTTVPAKPPPTKVPPADIKVRVVNAVDPAKTIAGPNADKLKNEKYTIVGTGDAPPPASDKSFVYYTGDMAAEATAIATILGIPVAQVLPVPATPPVALNGATVLVVIGKDKA
jgi:hypothetical protein